MSRSPFLTLLGHGCEDPRRRNRPMRKRGKGRRTKSQGEHPAAFNLATVDAIRLCWRRLRPSSSSTGKRSSSSLHICLGTDETAPRRGKASSLPVVLFAVAASRSQLTQSVTRPPGKYRVMPAKLLPPRSLRHFLLISSILPTQFQPLLLSHLPCLRRFFSQPPSVSRRLASLPSFFAPDWRQRARPAKITVEDFRLEFRNQNYEHATQPRTPDDLIYWSRSALATPLKTGQSFLDGGIKSSPDWLLSKRNLRGEIRHGIGSIDCFRG